MGKQVYLKRIKALFKESNVVTYSSLERLIRDRKKKSEYTKQLIKNLLHQGSVQRLTKGCYTTKDDASLLVFCLRPAYLGLQHALSAHNLWGQETIPIVITAQRARQGIRNVLGVNVLLRRIKRKYCFGITYLREGDCYLPYSDIEKTFIDMVYFKEHLDHEAIESIQQRLNVRTLESYLRRYPESLQKAVRKLL